MAFFNKTEEVIDLVLTRKGREMLSKGTLNPTYYSFYDDNTAYRFNDIYPIVEEKFEHYYKLLMETEHPLKEVQEVKELE